MAIVDHTGVRGESLAEHRADLERRFRAAFGEDFDLAPETPQGQIIGIVAQMLVEHDEQVVAQGSALALDHAVGGQLDDLGSLLGITRAAASRSTVTALAYGVAGTLLPAGSRARTTAGVQFSTLADAVLSPTGVSVEMQAVETGPILAAAGSLTEIVTLVPGWERIDNPSPALPGRAVEADSEYRDRYRARTARPSTGPTEALRAALFEVGATRVRVEENDLSTLSVRQMAILHPHAILCVVAGGTDASVTAAIRRTKTIGAPLIAAVFGGTPDEPALTNTAFNTIEWGGVAYMGGTMASGHSIAERLEYVNDALPAEVRLTFDGQRYVAYYQWVDGETPGFGTGNVASLFGLQDSMITRSPGPFLRPVDRPLEITATVTIERAAFPADGLAQMRQALIDRVGQYGLGETVWPNDLLCAVEAVGGTRVTSFAVTQDGAALATPSLDTIYSLAEGDITLTLAES